MKKRIVNEKRSMHPLLMMFTSKITNDFDFDANVVVVVVAKTVQSALKFISI